jgi:hypothetical protein
LERTEHIAEHMLAQFVTFGLYSPMTITVQCAAAGGEQAALTVPAGASLDDAAQVFNTAAAVSRGSGAEVLVRFE